MQLGETQYAAVRHKTGPALVLAGPGSGKTRVITERVRFLINKCGIKPNNILVVTFTRAAAEEMKERYEKAYSDRGVWFGTFHSIFFTILKSAYGYSVSDILKEDEKRQIITKAMKHFDTDIEEGKDIISDIAGEISLVKSMRYNPETYYSLKFPAEQWQYVYKAYDGYLKKHRKIDFDDMMLYTYELFCARKDILSGWQRLFQFILIDEFQDINKLQYDIIKMLAAPPYNLFCVGDDDQSIYGFRGSNPDIMKAFLKDFDNPKKIILNINYRCDAMVMEAADRLIKHNKFRMDKDISPYKRPVNSVDIRGFETINDEYKEVTDIITDYIKKGVSPSGIAVLYRTNMQPQPLINKLLERSINVRVKEGVPNIFNHFIAKDIFAYIKLSLGYGGSMDFMRIMNKPKRYIARDMLGLAEVDYDSLADLYEEKPWMVSRIYQMRDDIASIKEMKPHKGICFIEKVIGYGDYLKEYAEYRNIDKDNLFEILGQIKELSLEYDSYGDFLSAASEYDKWTRDGGKYSEKYGSDAVAFMTLHGVKGLEFEKVIIIDVNEEIIPHKLSISESEIEEERRLLYVGITRAKDKLHLFYTKNRHSHSVNVSRFIEEIEKKND